jgi:hypothetical protein
MRLDPLSLNVQSFETSLPSETEPIGDTGRGGPESFCYICLATGNTDPRCHDQPQPLPDTYFYPCTNQLTCRTCV